MLSFCPAFYIALWSGISVVLETLTDKLESLNKCALRIVFNDKVSYQQLLRKSEGATLYKYGRIQNMLITIILQMLEL